MLFTAPSPAWKRFSSSSDTPMSPGCQVRQLGQVSYLETWQRMQAFTDERDAQRDDEIWLLEHPPVFTLGMNASRDHLLGAGGIPVVQTDRGGQITYHAPGQLVVYTLLDLKRAGMGVRALVTALENSVVKMAGQFGIQARARADAPGVYVQERKLASLGIRVRRGCSYHGLSLNVNLDLAPFKRIDPCGHPGMEVTSLWTLGVEVDVDQAGQALLPQLAQQLGLELRPGET